MTYASNVKATGKYVQITNGTDELDVLTQNAAYGTAVLGLPILGKYEATPTTYDDNDAVPIALDANGRVKISEVDIEIGAVELKNASTDDRGDISDANTARATTTHVLATQLIGADGTVPPTGSLNTNAAFTKLTDGTSNLTLGTGTVKTVPSEIHDGTTGVDVIATINSLKSDISSIAGTATNVNGGNRDTGTQTVTLADDDPAVVSLAALDNAIKVDDAAFTPATDSVSMIGAEFDDVAPDSVHEGDAGALRMSANRNLYATIRDAAGNERGVNVTAASELNVLDSNSADIKTAVQIIDDWDETDRAKVNPIAGQAGIAANAGAMDALTTRITIATDDTHFGAVGAASDVDGVAHGQLRYIGEASNAIQTATELIDDTVYTDGSGTPSKGILIMGTDGTNPQAVKVNSDGELAINLETSDIEIGAVELKNAATDDRALIQDANTAKTAADHVLLVQNYEPTTYAVIQTATAPVDNAENQIGTDINVTDYNNITFGITYVKGDETKVTITIYKLLTSAGTAYPIGYWGAGANASFTVNSFDITASASRTIALNVSDCAYARIKVQMADGTPTGTIAASYFISNNGSGQMRPTAVYG